MCQHPGPSLFVLDARLLVGKSLLSEPYPRAVSLGSKLNGDDRLRSAGPDGKPGQLDQPVLLKAEKPAVIRAPDLAAVMCLEEEDGVDLGLHQDRPRRRKPAVDLLRPGSVHHGRRRGETARDSYLEGPSGEVWLDDGWGFRHGVACPLNLSRRVVATSSVPIVSLPLRRAEI